MEQNFNNVLNEIKSSPRQINWKNEEIEQIIATINSVLTKYNLSEIKFETGRTFISKYTNTGKYGNKTIWWITDKMIPELATNEKLYWDIYWALKKKYPEYIQDNTIKMYKKSENDSIKSDTLASIKVVLGNLKSNCFTNDDLIKYKNGDIEVINRLNVLESRTFRRADDIRTAEQRFSDFNDADNYEPKLEAAILKNMTDLKLRDYHKIDTHTIDPDMETDYTGKVNGVPVDIEGKSTKALIEYNRDFSSDFANYITDRLKNGSLGSIHDANYVLLVLKQTGDVICFNAKNPKENWLAGHINL